MRAISMSRTVAVLVVLGFGGACTDEPTGPDLPPPDFRPDFPGTMTLAPQSATIRPGETILLHARLSDRSGHTVDGVKFTWRSSDSQVAVVSAAGVVVGRRPGRALITASARGKSQAATIDVQFHGPKAPLEPDPDQDSKGGAR